MENDSISSILNGLNAQTSEFCDGTNKPQLCRIVAYYVFTKRIAVVYSFPTPPSSL